MGMIYDAGKAGIVKALEWIKEGPTPERLAEKAEELMKDLDKEEESEETDQDEDE